MNPPTTPHRADTEVARLREEIVGLRAELEDLRDERTSRRRFVRTALALGAGGAAAALGAAAPAAATTGAMQFGAANNAGTSETSLAASRGAGRALSVGNSGTDGYAFGGEADTVYGGHGSVYGIDMTSGGTGARLRGSTVGIHAIAANTGGFDAVGVIASGGTVGVYAAGDRAPLMLEKRSGPIAFLHYSGELHSLGSGSTASLWFTVQDGTPGVSRKVAGPDTAGALHPVDPFRVYDSRLDAAWAASRIAAGENRLVSVADARDLATGAVSLANAVPEGATAIAYNLAVVDTVGAGFLSVTPGGATTYSAASINWSAAGQILANGQLAKLDASRRVQVFAGGGTGAAAHFVIDVQGYYL